MSEVSCLNTLTHARQVSAKSLPGTNTDGVLIDVTQTSAAHRGVLAHFKAPTTPNVSDGIEDAVRRVLQTSKVAVSAISCVSIGTTAFVNAVLEADASRLEKVAVIRLCGPYTRQCPPFIDIPPALKLLTDGHVAYLDGGFESAFFASYHEDAGAAHADALSVDGREITPVNEEQVVAQCKIVRDKGIRNVRDFDS